MTRAGIKGGGVSLQQHKGEGNDKTLGGMRLVCKKNNNKKQTLMFGKLIFNIAIYFNIEKKIIE